MLALAGCGQSDEDAAEEAVRDFVQATNDGDPAACDRLVTARYLEQSTGEKGDAATRICREQLKTLGGADITIEGVDAVQVDGERAQVTVRLNTGDVKETRVISLVREDDEWRLDGGREKS